MKKVFIYISTYILTFLLFACQTSDKNTIDLSKPAGTIIQKFSDIADNLRAIPLETSDSCLLSPNLKIWIGNSYIVTADENAIHLFDKNGKHLKQLANQGKGPGEFISVAAFTVDEDKERLYYRDWNQRSTLRVIDLKTGENTGKLEGKPDDFVAMVVTADHSLLCCPHTGWGKDSKNDLVTLSTTGELLCQIVADTAQVDKAKNIFNPYLCKTGNRITYWNPNTDHILFQIEDSLKTPFLVFNQNNPFTYEKRRGDFLRIKAETPNELMIQVQKYEIFIEDEETFGVRGIPNSKIYNYRIGKNDRAVYLIDRFYDDLLGEEYPNLPTITTTNGDHIFIQKSTMHIKQLAEKQLKAGKELTPELKELDARLKDDDNPVILVGTLKKKI